jgi:hypothetical protein
MPTLRASLAAALLTLGGAAFAQAGEGTRGSVAPGSSLDGARPSDGAITGGPLLPGETSGMPDGAAVPKTASERARERCYELPGSLREECLLKERSASIGGSTAPAMRGARELEPRITPPPQSPR